MNILMIGAHPDDCDLRCSGLASLYVQAGHRVRFLSMCDGSGGHQTMNRNEIAARRWGETREAAKVIGIEYDVWNIPDCEIQSDLPTRERLIRYIRAFRPDVVFCHRTNDYHADHRASGLLVQEASYLLIVPNYNMVIGHEASNFRIYGNQFNPYASKGKYSIKLSCLGSNQGTVYEKIKKLGLKI